MKAARICREAAFETRDTACLCFPQTSCSGSIYLTRVPVPSVRGGFGLRKPPPAVRYSGGSGEKEVDRFLRLVSPIITAPSNYIQDRPGPSIYDDFRPPANPQVILSPDAPPISTSVTIRHLPIPPQPPNSLKVMLPLVGQPANSASPTRCLAVNPDR